MIERERNDASDSRQVDLMERGEAVGAVGEVRSISKEEIIISVYSGQSNNDMVSAEPV